MIQSVSLAIALKNSIEFYFTGTRALLHPTYQCRSLAFIERFLSLFSDIIFFSFFFFSSFQFSLDFASLHFVRYRSLSRDRFVSPRCHFSSAPFASVLTACSLLCPRLDSRRIQRYVEKPISNIDVFPQPHTHTHTQTHLHPHTYTRYAFDSYALTNPCLNWWRGSKRCTSN